MSTEMYRYLSILIKAAAILFVLGTVFFAVNYVIPMLFDVSLNLLWVFMPFLLALIIAVLIDPVVDWLEKKRIKRGLSVAVTLILLLALVSVIIVLVVSRLVVELSTIYSNLPVYTQYWMQFGLQSIEQIRNYITNHPLPAEVQEALRSNLQSIMAGARDVIRLATSFLIGLLKGLPGFITIIIIAGMATFFISRDKHRIIASLFRLMPKKYVKPLSAVISEINKAMIGFFRAQTILISITCVLSIIGLYILDVKYALTLGIAIGIFDLLPVLGPGTILVPWAIFHFTTGKIGFGLSLLVLYGVVLGVRQMIQPKILSQNLGLHPLETLVSLYLGFKLIGVWGIILGPLLVILGRSLLSSFSKQD